MKYNYANKRILLVSDDHSAREALGEMLRAANLDVIMAEDGRRAEKALLDHLISLIVLDFRTRFDAKDAGSRKSKTLIALTDVDPFLPLILTCDAKAELNHETALMADLVLKHPVQPSALLEGIETLLSESLNERVFRKSDYIAALR